MKKAREGGREGKTLRNHIKEECQLEETTKGSGEACITVNN